MFIIPMAGLSSRFFKAGYVKPKYQLVLPNNLSMFEWSMRSFEYYFKTDTFLFLVRDLYETQEFVKEKCTKLGILNFIIVVLSDETRGQAETVYLGLKNIIDKVDVLTEEVYVFNIDSYRHHFKKPNISKKCDGYIEVFQGEGDHWSFIEINDSGKVIRTTEKERISNLCSDGLYFFKNVKKYLNLVEKGIEHNKFVKGELYIAPLYNLIIQEGGDIRYGLIDITDIEFCGTPTEFMDISNKMLGT